MSDSYTTFKLSTLKHSNGSTFYLLHVMPKNLPSFYIELPKNAIDSGADLDLSTNRLLLSQIQSGLTPFFQYTLEISGVGFRIWKDPSFNRKLFLNIGQSTPAEFTIPLGIEVDIKKNGVEFEIKGSYKDEVSLFASKIRDLKPAKKDKYKHKGISIINHGSL